MIKSIVKSVVDGTVGGIISGDPGGADPLFTGLVGWWSLDETSGTRVDSHTNSLNLTDNNTVGFAAGKVSNAADFESGNNEYLSRASSDAVLNPSGDFTFAAWYKAETILNTGFLGGKWNAATSQKGWAVILAGPTDKFQCLASSDGSTTAVAEWGAAASTDQWYFVVGYYDSTASEIGIIVDDGTPVTESFTGPCHASTAPFHMSSDGSGASSPSWSDGLEDEAAFWSRKLTAAEITRLYNSGSGIGYPG